MNRKNKIFGLFKISKQSNPEILEKIADRILRNLDLKNEATRHSEEYFLKQTIYDYYTKISDSAVTEAVSSDAEALANMSKEERKNNKGLVYWNQFLLAMEDTANRRGWVANNSGNPDWIQYQPSNYTSDQNRDTYKKYVTFNRVDGGKLSMPIFYSNISKLPRFLADFIEMQNSGQFFGNNKFKIPSNLHFALRHKDSIVIWFKDPRDEEKINQLVNSAGFDMIDRASIGRPDIGVDKTSNISGKHTSDSDLAAERAFVNIMHNKQVLEPMLRNPSRRNEAINAIKYILDKTMETQSRTI